MSLHDRPNDGLRQRPGQRSIDHARHLRRVQHLASGRLDLIEPANAGRTPLQGEPLARADDHRAHDRRSDGKPKR
jgi:hypothetical protein